MADLTFRAKRKPITYGKTSRKVSLARPIDLDSEDELAKPAILNTGKALKMPQAKVLPTRKPVTPPDSPSPNATSPSVTSPSSGAGTKRGSPFPDSSPQQQKRKVRVVSKEFTKAERNGIFDEAHAAGAARQKKGAYRQSKQSPPRTTTSDETQILLDRQLDDFTDIVQNDFHQQTPFKKGGLKMPTRPRQTQTATYVTQPSPRSPQKPVEKPTSLVAKPLSKETKVVTASVIKSPVRQPRRPQTPERTTPVKLSSPIFSPSNLELDEMTISTVAAPRIKMPQANLKVPVVTTSPRASPGRPKLKDRLVSDLANIVDDMDTTMEETITSPNTRFLSETNTSDSIVQTAQTGGSQQLNPPNQSSQPAGSKVTYTAAKWTFLPDEDDETASLDLSFNSPKSNGKKTRQLPDLNKSISKIEDFDMEISDGDEPSTTMRSLHELKRAGNSQRVNRQIEALLDDIENSSTKTQRLSAVLELLTKLRQSTFLRQFLDAGSEGRLIGLLQSTDFPMLRTLYSMALLLILDSQHLSTVAISSSARTLSDYLGKHLTSTTDIVAASKMRNSNISNEGQRNLEKLCKTLLNTSVWSDAKPTVLTGKLLALASLDRLVPKLRESGNIDDLLSASTIEHLVDMLKEWNPDADALVMYAMSTSLSVLESAALIYSLSQQISSVSWSRKSGNKLIAFCSQLQPSPVASKYGSLVSLALRLCLNLSNGDAETCALFSNLSFINMVLSMTQDLFGKLSAKNKTNDQDMILDNLVLSLGLLINLSEKRKDTRSLFLQGDSPEVSPLETLLQLFLSRLQEAFEVTSEAEIRSNIPFGYLAVLLGYLCKDDANFHRVRSRLDGGNLRLLLIAIGEFLHYHQKVEELGKIEGEAEIKITFISRLQGLVNELRAKESAASATS